MAWAAVDTELVEKPQIPAPEVLDMILPTKMADQEMSINSFSDISSSSSSSSTEDVPNQQFQDQFERLQALTSVHLPSTSTNTSMSVDNVEQRSQQAIKSHSYPFTLSHTLTPAWNAEETSTNTSSSSSSSPENRFAVKQPHVFYLNDRQSPFADQHLDSQPSSLNRSATLKLESSVPNNNNGSIWTGPLPSRSHTQNLVSLKSGHLQHHISSRPDYPQPDVINAQTDPNLFSSKDKNSKLTKEKFQLENELGLNENGNHHINEFKQNFAHEWTTKMSTGFQSKVGNQFHHDRPYDFHPPLMKINPIPHLHKSIGQKPVDASKPHFYEPTPHPPVVKPEVDPISPPIHFGSPSPIVYQCCKYIFPAELLNDHLLYMMRQPESQLHGNPGTIIHNSNQIYSSNLKRPEGPESFVEQSGPFNGNVDGKEEQEEPPKAAKLEQTNSDHSKSTVNGNDQDSPGSQEEASFGRPRFTRGPEIPVNFGSCVPIYQLPAQGFWHQPYQQRPQHHRRRPISSRKMHFLASLFRKPVFG